jgi:predicted phosphoribosyltransferase
VALIRREADAVVCLLTLKFFFVVGAHYASSHRWTTRKWYA